MVRGDVYEIKLPGKLGHVQSGRRYAVVVQADDLLALSTVVICPTSQSAFSASFHPEVVVAERSTQVLCEMVGAIDARALGKRVGHLAHDELREVEDAARLVLDLT
ncbi:MAG TPA: type II toxin-antitoxin system PemK/MazF family toxin [Solirubrobacteraceae bacterium]